MRPTKTMATTTPAIRWPWWSYGDRHRRKIPLKILSTSISSSSIACSRIDCCCSESKSKEPSKREPKSRIRRRKFGLEGENGREFVVVNFYKFVFIEEPHAEVAKHLNFLEERDICGRIYINEQGINAQYSGLNDDALAYCEWLKEDQRFSDILVQVSPVYDGHAFPQLKLRYKPSLVQMEGGVAHLPLLDPAMRASPLAPSEWRKRLLASKSSGELSNNKDISNSNRNLLLLDVRNGYEWDIGHFQGAQRPNVDCFRSTSFGMAEEVEDPLNGIDKENTDILMYCTGGIRCDVYSAILRQRGFNNLYTLSGGVANYLKQEGTDGWIGNLFVFDSRLALPPSTYNPETSDDKRPPVAYPSGTTFGKCSVCGTELLEFKHRNCANLDCNLLFLSCNSCVEQLKGCCSLDCTCAQRLRPLLPGQQRYEKWHIYRDSYL